MMPFVQMGNVPFLIPLKTNNKQKAEAEIPPLLFVYLQKNSQKHKHAFCFYVIISLEATNLDE